MRRRSRSRNYDNGDYHRYDSSRSRKDKKSYSHNSIDDHKGDYRKSKRSQSPSKRSRYDRHHDSSAEKYDKKLDGKYSKSTYKRSSRDDSYYKSSRKYEEHDRSKRQHSDSTSSSQSNDKSKKKDKYKDSYSSDDSYRKSKTDRDRNKDKKLKKKAKKSDKDKKKRKKHRHSSEEETDKKPKMQKVEKPRTIKEEEREKDKEKEKVDDVHDKIKVKVEPFKVREQSNLKSQINVMGSTNAFVKDEVPKLIPERDVKIKVEARSRSKERKVEILHKSKPEDDANNRKNKIDEDRDYNDRKRIKKPENSRSAKKEPEESGKKSPKTHYESMGKRERSRSACKPLEKEKEKVKSRDRRGSHRSVDEKKKYDEDFDDDERLEYPRTPTDAQFTGLFARLHEEPVSETEIEDILPPILLDDQMKTLLENDPNVTQEAWDSEDDVLLNKKENVHTPKHRGILETLSVPWQNLIEEASLNQNNLEKNRGLNRFSVMNVLKNIGLSKTYCSDDLWEQIQSDYSISFLSSLAPVHQFLLSENSRRKNIFSERRTLAGALSARKDILIRQVLNQTIMVNINK